MERGSYTIGILEPRPQQGEDAEFECPQTLQFDVPAEVVIMANEPSYSRDGNTCVPPEVEWVRPDTPPGFKPLVNTVTGYEAPGFMTTGISIGSETCPASLGINFFTKYDYQPLTPETLRDANSDPEAFRVLFQVRGTRCVPGGAVSTYDYCNRVFQAKVTSFAADPSLN